jgi:rubrerythrin
MADAAGGGTRNLDPLLADMRMALLAEFGAHAIYGCLARSRRDSELSDLLERFRDEEREQIERLRALIESLGGRPPRGHFRRKIVPFLLGVAAGLGLRRLALRSCLDSEETVSRWYRQYAVALARAGDLASARVCEALAETKQRHAFALLAWVAR